MTILGSKDDRPAFMRDERYLGRFASRWWRLAGLAGVCTGWTLTLAGTALREWWIGGPALLATVLCLVYLQLATRNLSNTMDAWADERDRAVRDHATRLAYWTLGPVIGAAIGAVGGLAGTALSTGDTLSLDAGSAPWVLLGCWTLALLYAVLPTAVLVWREPDPEFDDEPDHLPFVEAGSF